MSQSFLGGKVVLHGGDSRDVLKTMPDASIDSVVCDPPYALVSIVKRFGSPNAAPAKGNDAYARASAGFMGKQWDTGEVAFAAEFWTEVLRVLKPGGHLVAFSGTRTYHRMACAIEDAGFEIRDSIYWHYGSGFPKSLNVGKQLDDGNKRCVCSQDLRDLPNAVGSDYALSSGTQPDLQSERLQAGAHWEAEHREGVTVQSQTGPSVRSLRETDGAAPTIPTLGSAPSVLKDVQRRISWDGVGNARAQRVSRAKNVHPAPGGEEPSVERRGDLPQTQRQLRQREVRAMPAGVPANGARGRLHDGAPAGDGEVGGATAHAAGMRAPQGPQPIEQLPQQPGTVAVQPDTQASGAWPTCGRCGKPIVPDGLGTALKPATEPICLARKPLTGTVAANVLEHGTGALNIDGCRVEGTPEPTRFDPKKHGHDGYRMTATGADCAERASSLGRWPANLLHDGSEEVLEAFPDRKTTWVDDGHANNRSGEFLGQLKHPGTQGYNDDGSAARFFYTAKADAEDRLGSKHPTVKPLDLMQWLVRLVTPPGGVCLDPFAGTGTTGEAAWREGMRAVLIEREAEYQADIARRMGLADKPTKRAAVAKTKNNLDDPNDLPLFKEAAQ